MNTDTLSFIVKSSVDKAKNSVKTMINVFQQYNNTLDKTKKSMQNVGNSTNNVDNNFNKSKQNIDDMINKLKKMKDVYKAHQKEFDNRSFWEKTSTVYAPKDKYGLPQPDKAEFINQAKLDNEKKAIEELEAKLKELGYVLEEQGKKALPKGMVPKELPKNIKDLGNSAKNSTHKVSRLGNILRSLGNISKNIGSKGFDSLKNKFKDFTKGFGKGVDSNIKEIKKLALGLIGVRTAMSVLTKSVNAYLSFDSELQDSLNNSWNMLGSLLAPAIEFVARMFAIATNYVAQFVNALTGINLVARANAKALQTQAKANAKANEAQRGLLGMDEITNLPSEPGGAGEAPQIKMDDTIKSFKELDDILNHLKNGEWHKVGEDIALNIDNLLSSINWEDIKQKAYNMGYNFADFLNGLFEVDWSQIGTTIAETFNTFVSTIQGFVDKFSFIRFGFDLGNMFTHAITDIDWVNLATTINKSIQGLADMIVMFLKTVDWGGIGESFGTFVKNIDWGNILFQAIKISILAFNAFREFLASFLVTLFWDVIEPIKEPFVQAGDLLFDYIDSVIRSIVGLFKSPIDYISNAFSMLVDTIKLLLKGDLLGAVKTVAKGIGNAFIIALNFLIDALNIVITPIRTVLNALASVTGNKGKFDNVRIPKLKQLETGTPEIKTEGIYHLHEGEMVVPKKYNPNTDGYDSGADNKQIIDLLISLNTNLIDYANRPIDIDMNSRKVAEAIYNDIKFLDNTKNKSTAVVRS